MRKGASKILETLQSITSLQIRNFITTPERAVELTRDLIWAQAGSQLTDLFKISVSSKIHSKDGGIDGTTIDISPSKKGLLTKGITDFQIKWGKTFDAKNKKHLRKELVSNKKLKPKIEELANKKGRYVLVWYGDVFKSNEKQECLENLQDIFSEFKFTNMKVDVLDQDDISLICNLHPVIISNYFSPTKDYFATLDTWKDRFWNIEINNNKIESILNSNRLTIKTLVESNMINPYQPVQLLSNTNEDHLTNQILVLKILSSNGLKQKTICVDAENFNPPLSTTLENRNDLNQIIVIDNCKKSHHEKLLNVIGQRHRRLNMIILSTDYELIQDHSFAKVGWHGSQYSSFLSQIDKKPDESVGNEFYFQPQVPSLKSISLPTTIPPIYSSISEDYGFEKLNNVKRVLRYLALFSSIGSENNRTKELEFLAKYAGFTKESWLDFIETIQILRNQNLIKGKYFIKISDEGFRKYLIQEWWEIYGSSFDFNEFLTNVYAFSENLASRLIDSIPLITTSEKGQEVSKTLLSLYGIFGDGNLFKDDFGARLFSKLADADPDSALKCLLSTIGNWSIDELKKFDTRRNIVFTLEKLSWWSNLFKGSVQLLVKLGEAENEHGIANNASGVFTSLFSPGYGKIATTEVPPLERLSILKLIFDSGSDEKIKLSLNALNEALESMNFTRFVAGNLAWQRRPFNPWTPKTYGEIFDYYRQVWTFLERQIENVSDEFKNKILEILTSRSRGLIRIVSLREMVIETLKHLSEKKDIDKEKIVNAITLILKFDKDKLDEKTIKGLEEIDQIIIGSSYHSKIKRIVGMHVLAEESKNISKITDVAKEGIRNKNQLKKEIPWLIKKGAKQARIFGIEIGKLNKKFTLLDFIINEQKKVKESEEDLSFLGGYLEQVFDSSPTKCDELFKKLSRNKKTAKWLLRLTVSSRMKIRDKDLNLLIKLAKQKKLDLREFGTLVYREVISNVSSKVFLDMGEILLPSNETYFTLVEIFYHYYIHRQTKKLPEKFTYKLLSSKILSNKAKETVFTHDLYSYEEISKEFVEQYPKQALKLLKKFLDEGKKPGTFIDRFDRELKEILDKLAKQDPKELWKLISTYLDPPYDVAGFRLRNWLRGALSFGENSIGGIINFEQKVVFEWVDKRPEDRTKFLAAVVPSGINELQKGWTREIIMKYGADEQVRRSLMSNFSTEGFSGSEVQHYENKKQNILEIRKHESDVNILQFIDEYTASLNLYIERAKRFEESFNP